MHRKLNEPWLGFGNKEKFDLSSLLIEIERLAAPKKVGHVGVVVNAGLLVKGS
jgi:hypothetical protein